MEIHSHDISLIMGIITLSSMWSHQEVKIAFRRTWA